MTVRIPPTGSGDATPAIATEADGSGNHHQLIIVEFGSSGTQTRVSSANPLPTDPSDRSGRLLGHVTVDSLPSGLAVDRTSAASPGAVELSDGSAFYTAAKSGQLPSALTGSGSLKVAIAEAGTATPVTTPEDATPGSAVPSKALYVAGTDGTNARGVLLDSTGQIMVSSGGTTGSAVPTRALQVAGSDGTNLRALKTSAAGVLSVDASGTTVPTDPSDRAARVLGTVTQGSAVSASNSSTVTLTANSVFTGTSDDCLTFEGATVVAFADQASATNGLSVQWSQDGANWDFTETYTVSANKATVIHSRAAGRYLRVVYTNGGTGQGTFRLQAIKRAAMGWPRNVLNTLGAISNTSMVPGMLPIGVGANSGNLSALGLIDADGIGFANGPLAAGLAKYNGSNFDRERNNTNLTALSSSARTATTNSADQTNYNGDGLLACLAVSAASGTGGLQLVIQGKETIGNNYFNINATPTAVTATGVFVYEIDPGIGAASGGVTQRTSASVPRDFRVQVIHGDASSYTYSVQIKTVVA